MKKNTTLPNTTSRLLATLALVMMVLGAAACGDSEAVYALQDEPGAMMNNSANNGEPDGKGDTPIDPTPELPEAPGDDVTLSAALLEFEGSAYEALIMLESEAEVVDAFGQGAVVCSHNTMIGGVVLNWDGEAAGVYVRRRDMYGVGPWTALEMEVADGGSFRGRAAFEGDLSQVDIYIANPEAVDFLMIEPLQPL